MKKISVIILSMVSLLTSIFMFNIFGNQGETIENDDILSLTSKSAILMEPVTGEIIYEKNAHERLRPASVTKIMTLLLIYEAVSDGKINWQDEVVVSEHAAGMGGSQVYLEPNEIQTVATMTKCIAVASANDASVAMAEHIAGSEEAFVKMMNEKAKELGMNDTNFENASGLDADNHLTSAYDIAIMSRELTTKYPEIFDLTSIWIDSITHHTARGDEEFGLTNTNKLIPWYEGATGLKTGSTSKALYCLSGTATRNNLDLIAVVMAAPDYKTRFQEVMKMFDYGFAVCKKYSDNIKGKSIGEIQVKKGIVDTVDIVASDDFNKIITDQNIDINKIEKKVDIPEILEAPIEDKQKVGEIVYYCEDKELGKVDVVTNKEVPKAKYSDYLNQILNKFFSVN